MRKAIEIPIEELCSNFDIQYLPSNCQVRIFIDEENFDLILDILRSFKKKAEVIFYYILNCRYNNDLYGKEIIDKETSNITAMKFKGKGKENYRIYCKEYYEEGNIRNKRVVLILPFKKKTKKINKELRNLIKKISRYEYF